MPNLCVFRAEKVHSKQFQQWILLVESTRNAYYEEESLAQAHDNRAVSFPAVHKPA